MRARRVEPFAKIDDPFFNHVAAKKAFDLVMKMDIDEARLFTTMVIGDEVVDLIEKNHRTLQRHLDEIVDRQLDSFSKGLSSMVFSKRLGDQSFDEDKALATAGAVAIIKSQRNQYTYGQQFRENEVRRGPGGRFTFKVKRQTMNKPMLSRDLNASPIHDAVGASKYYQNLDDTKKAEFQSQYLQVASALDSFGDRGFASLLIQNKNGGPIEEKKFDTLERKAVLSGSPVDNPERGMDVPWDPKTENVVGVTIAPDQKELTVGQASFSTMHALGSSPENAYFRSQQIQAANDNATTFHDQWLAPGADDYKNSNARTYRRIAAGSQFVGQVAPSGSKLEVASAFGRMVGDRGPEAERIIGPSARKAAYRYRGVTKKPDADLLRAYNTEREHAKPVVAGELAMKIKIAQNRALETQRGKSKKPLPADRENRIRNVAAKKVLANAQISEPQMELLRNNVADKLKQVQGVKRPSAGLYGLQLNAGHLPPSEGVIIDAKGNLVTQAVGYSDDHYLPFNLRDLGKLRGGEYIRTRSVGGPTAEDIYAGYIAGAKALTVTSRSGTFQVVFEDDFRGTRRYNDKAKRMIDRYEKLLDAVQSKKVARPGDPPPAVVTALVADVRTKNPGLSPELTRAEVLSRLGSMAASEDITPDDEDVMRYMGPDKVEAKRMIQLAKEKNYKLNGAGYDSALQALQEQFPYYIKSVKWKGPDEKKRLDEGFATDQGYVMPKHNRPKAAKAGYFAPEVAGRSGGAGIYAESGKFDASLADFQNFKLSRSAAGATAHDDEPDRARVAQAAAHEATTEATDEAKQSAAADAIEAMWGHFLETSDGGKYRDGETTKYFKDEIGSAKDVAKDFEDHGIHGPKVKAMLEVLNHEGNAASIFGAEGASTTSVQDKSRVLRSAMNDALGKASSKPFSADAALNDTEFAPTFAEYDKLTTKAQVKEEIDEVGIQLSVMGSMFIGQMDDADLREELRNLSKLSAELGKDEVKALSPAAQKKHFADMGFPTEGEDNLVQPAIANPAILPRLGENVQRVRALKVIKERIKANAPRETSQAPSTPNKQPEDEETVRGAVNETFEALQSPKERRMREAARMMARNPRRFDTGLVQQMIQGADALAMEQAEMTLTPVQQGQKRQAERALEFYESKSWL